jgi:hypothetical protein
MPFCNGDGPSALNCDGGDGLVGQEGLEAGGADEDRCAYEDEMYCLVWSGLRHGLCYGFADNIQKFTGIVLLVRGSRK